MEPEDIFSYFWFCRHSALLRGKVRAAAKCNNCIVRHRPHPDLHIPADMRQRPISIAMRLLRDSFASRGCVGPSGGGGAGRLSRSSLRLLALLWACRLVEYVPIRRGR
jgi:hypothetical protein